MGAIKYSIRFDKEEEAKYKELAKKLNRPLSIIIRDALDTICENPSILNQTTQNIDLDMIISALEISAKDRLRTNAKFNKEIQDKFRVLDQKINYLLKEAKIPKKTLKKLEGMDVSGEEIFD